MRNEVIPFRPKARIMELLGDQLIRSHVLALFELIKNSYDADANLVSITLADITSVDNGTITIQDDGTGMSFETVSTVWMEPGNSHKLEQRKLLVQKPRSERGRLPIGEKGVGRFAVHRLGKKIELITRSRDCMEVVIEIDWDLFLQNDYLDNAGIKVLERKPEVFTEEQTGTKITVSRLKNRWTRGEIRKLYRQVLGMTDAPISLRSVQGFHVDFNLKDNKDWLQDFVKVQDIQHQAFFKFDFVYRNNGLAFRYKFTPPEAMEADFPDAFSSKTCVKRRRNSEFFINSQPSESESWKKRKQRAHRPKLVGKNSLGIGIVRGSILAFDLDAKIQKKYKTNQGVSDFLKEQGGVRVYRDGLRVYDYGEQGNDWLGLDHRRIQNPSVKLSNKLILGEIHLDLTTSTSLHEKTSREGFIENEAYSELRYALITALAEFEVERNKHKRQINAVMSGLRYSKSDSGVRETTEYLLDKLATEVKVKQLPKEIEMLVEKVSQSYVKARNALLSSAGVELGLVTVFHELERGIKSLHKSIISNSSVEELRSQSSELISMFQGAIYIVNKSSMEVINASKIVQMALNTQVRRFQRHDVDIRNGFDSLDNQDFQIKVVRKMVITSIINLIDNAIYWLDKENINKEKIIWIGPSNDLEAPSIIISDNGPGFEDDPVDLIEPFFSRREEGMGIGLHYTDWAMRAHNGRLAFPEKNTVDVPNAMTGAILALVFPKIG